MRISTCYLVILFYMLSIYCLLLLIFSPSGHAAGVSVSYGARCRNGSSGIKKHVFSSLYIYKENRITVISMESVAWDRHFLTVIYELKKLYHVSVKLLLIETEVEVWENVKPCGNASRLESVFRIHSFFFFLTTHKLPRVFL